jgi:hypothetical protein
LGSIGDGKSRIPAVFTFESADTRNNTHEPIRLAPPPFDQSISYTRFRDVEETGVTRLTGIHSLPSDEQTKNYPSPLAQEHLNAFMWGSEGFQNVLVEGIQRRGLSDTQSLVLAGRASVIAERLREQGQHHQAFALEWTVGAIRSVDSDLFDLFTTVEESVSEEWGDPENPFEPVIVILGEKPLIGVITDNGHAFHTLYSPDSSPKPLSDKELRKYVATADLVIRLCDIEQDAVRAYQGAAISDFLPLTGNDPEAAAVMSTLLPSYYGE